MTVQERSSTHTSAVSAWLDLRAIANIHASSEDREHPIDHALLTDAKAFWRAAEGGEQLIELRFHSPRNIARIRLSFVEEDRPRTQQFTIRWSSRRGETHGEVVRQQFNFSPSGATSEIEDYRVDLHDVESLQILVNPDIASGPACATLAHLQLA